MKILPVVLETLSITRVGTTGVYFDYSSADLVTYKIPLQINDENYYIPAISATSFKGLLRSVYERYLRKEKRGDVSGSGNQKVLENIKNLNYEERTLIFENLKEELEKYVYSGLIDKVGENLEEVFKQYLEITGYGIDKACYVTSDLDRCENLALIEDEKKRKLKEAWIKLTGRKNLCEVCKVLGTSGVRGFVKFTDLVAVDPFPVLLERITHVAINRITGTAEKGKLFTEEIIPAGVKFLGFLAVLEDSLTERVIEMLKVLRDKARKGEVWIGGRGSSGYGTFRLYIPGEVLEFNSVIFKGKFALNISEPREGLACERKIICKLFPETFINSLNLVTEGEVTFIVKVETGEEYEAKNGEELKEVLDKVKDKKYEIKIKGVWSLS